MSTAMNSSWAQIILCIALATLIGFQSIPSDSGWLSVLWVISVCCLFVVRGSAPIARLEFYAIIFLVVLFASIFFSQWPWVSFWVACSLSLMSIGFMIFLNDGSSVAKKYLKLSIVVFASCNASVVMFMSILHVDRTGGMFADANLAANLSVIAILILSESVVVDEKKHKLVVWLMLLFLGVATFSMQSRAAILVLLISFLFIFILCSNRYRKSLLTIFSVLVAAYFLSNMLLSFRVSDSISPFSRVESFNYRLDIWMSGLKLFFNSPWFGSGLGTFSLLYPAVREPSEVGTVGFFVHNDYLQLLLELGVFGFVACIAFPLIVIFKVAKGLIGTDSDSRRIQGFFLLSIIFTVAAHAFVNFIFYQPLLAFIFGSFLGIGAFEFVPYRRMNLEKIISPKMMKWSSAVVLSSIGLFGLISSGTDYLSREIISQSNVEKTAPSLSNNIYYELLPLSYFSPLNTSISNYLILSEANTAIAMADMDLGHELAEKTISRIERQAAFKSPNCIQLATKARLFWMLGKEDESIQLLDDSLEGAPDCVQARTVLADALVKNGQADEAITILNAGIDRIRFKEVLEGESKALFSALESALKAAGREQEADVIRAYLNLRS
ncbi:O-antigen ligase family protein [Marinobacter sp. 1_MG-2023]|uniref:O-antigen ligase family protein n=1 Tax=Marinobacter sp. 1_MG-2023 TaxID=3062627 RepID=UPI0026E1D9F6|nr:O-antigen ligase family protein [Marinobacter sp. 1_MG-2023]MDO6823286.1 O-antigen ligase family protein [Marinobacter sp. 1_MG-2023]